MSLKLKTLWVLVAVSFCNQFITEITSTTTNTIDQGVVVINRSEGYLVVSNFQSSRSFVTYLDVQGVIQQFTYLDAGVTAPHAEIAEDTVFNEYGIVSTYLGNLRLDILDSNLAIKSTKILQLGEAVSVKSVIFDDSPIRYVVVATATPTSGGFGASDIVIALDPVYNPQQAFVIGGAAAGSAQNAFGIFHLPRASSYLVTGTTQNSGGTVNNLIVSMSEGQSLNWAKIGSATNGFETHFCQELGTGELVFGGKVNVSPTAALFMKTDSSGNIVVAKQYQHASDNIEINSIAEDGSITLMVGKIGTDMLIMVITSAGTALYSRKFQLRTETVAYSITKSRLTANFIVTGKTVNSGNSNIFVAEVYADGTLAGSSYPATAVTVTTTDLVSAITFSDLPGASFQSLGSVTTLITDDLDNFQQTFLEPLGRSGATRNQIIGRISSTSTGSSSSSSQTDMCLFVGAGAGGAILIIIIINIIVCCCKFGKCRKNRLLQHASSSSIRAEHIGSTGMRPEHVSSSSLRAENISSSSVHAWEEKD